MFMGTDFDGSIGLVNAKCATFNQNFRDPLNFLWIYIPNVL